MYLEKYYLDMVTEAGAGAIGYCAKVKWTALNLTPSSMLFWPESTADAPSQKFALRGTVPQMDEANLSWREAAFATSAVWQRPAAPWREQTLWEADDVSVRWQVLAAASPVLWHRSGQTHSGYGYAECLRITGNPLRLPIDTLHWGRFVSAQRNVTWIVWHCGTTTRCWLWDNCDTPQDAVTVEADAICWSGHRIALQKVRTLRSGAIGETGLKPLSALTPLIPPWLLQVQESKWLSKGVYRGPGGCEAVGWVIHETVKIR